jgi:hypothetical protein
MNNSHSFFITRILIYTYLCLDLQDEILINNIERDSSNIYALQFMY